jgi:hypothetical protein
LRTAIAFFGNVATGQSDEKDNPDGQKKTGFRRLVSVLWQLIGPSAQFVHGLFENYVQVGLAFAVFEEDVYPYRIQQAQKYLERRAILQLEHPRDIAPDQAGTFGDLFMGDPLFFRYFFDKQNKRFPCFFVYHLITFAT